ncbi:MAG: exonuclease subunit SbcD, partial [Bacteroidaceae bacterium]|nr:exonuclease subunit SbcD [Bacteroidaceae bacterium]
LIVSGDIYDNPAPSVVAQNRFVHSVLDLHEACPDCLIVITAGNHDSGNRLDVHRPIWDRIGVKVVGSCQRAEDGTFNPNEFIVPVKDKGFVVAVPYFHAHNFPMAEADTEREMRQQRFFEKVMDAVHTDNDNGLPIVLMAHLAVEGCDIQGHEASVVGGMEKDNLNKLGSGYDYLALGHIHKPQDITERVRYSGSPMPLSFSEEYQHSVTIVEMEKHGDVPKISQMDISPLRNMKTITANSLEAALDELEMVEEELYVRVLVDQEGILPADAEQRAQFVVRGKPCRLCEVRKVIRKQSFTDEKEFKDIDITDSNNTIKPIDIAKRHFQKIHDTEMIDELTKMMDDVIEEVNNNENV